MLSIVRAGLSAPFRIARRLIKQDAQHDRVLPEGGSTEAPHSPHLTTHSCKTGLHTFSKWLRSLLTSDSQVVLPSQRLIDFPKTSCTMLTDFCHNPLRGPKTSYAAARYSATPTRSRTTRVLGQAGRAHTVSPVLSARVFVSAVSH